jgi:hypothetical protein
MAATGPMAAPSDRLSAIDVSLVLSDRGDVNDITACTAPSLAHLHCRMASAQATLLRPFLTPRGGKQHTAQPANEDHQKADGEQAWASPPCPDRHDDIAPPMRTACIDGVVDRAT